MRYPLLTPEAVVSGAWQCCRVDVVFHRTAQRRYAIELHRGAGVESGEAGGCSTQAIVSINRS